MSATPDSFGLGAAAGDATLGDQSPGRELAQQAPSVFAHLRELYRYRELLLVWGQREIKVRYKQSVLGAAWAVLQPLALMIVFTVVFSVIARVPSGGIPYPVFSYTALLPWTFLATAISFAVPSLVNNLNLVTKIYFPREILPMGSIIVAFVDFLIATAVFLGLIAYYRIPVGLSWLWVPGLLVVQTALTAGIVFFLSALSVRFRDIRFVVPLGLQIWMYASPIIYPVSLVPQRFQFLYMLNPMAGLIESYRRVIILGLAPEAGHLIPAAAVSALILVAGYSYFKREEALFADII
jgi:lipopolysaccharide transport system permease protein